MTASTISRRRRRKSGSTRAATPRTGGCRIGEAARATGLSADTLRYYERIGLLPPVGRAPSGIRIYSEKDLSRLRFVQRAQKMNFTLTEIGELLRMRDDPRRARRHVRALTAAKLDAVEARLEEITRLRNELRLLLNLCQASADGCPIVEAIGRRQDARSTRN